MTIAATQLGEAFVTSIAISPGNRIVIVVGLETIVAGTNDGVATDVSAASRFFH